MRAGDSARVLHRRSSHFITPLSTNTPPATMESVKGEGQDVASREHNHEDDSEWKEEKPPFNYYEGWPDIEAECGESDPEGSQPESRSSENESKGEATVKRGRGRPRRKRPLEGKKREK